MNQPTPVTDKQSYKSQKAGEVFCPNLFFKFSFRQCNFITSLQARSQALYEVDLQPGRQPFQTAEKSLQCPLSMLSPWCGEIDFTWFHSFWEHTFSLPVQIDGRFCHWRGRDSQCLLHLQFQIEDPYRQDSSTFFFVFS